MKLGMLVTTDKHPDDVLGIARAALAKGHEVIIFSTDEGVRLINNASFQELGALTSVNVSFCDLSTQHYGVSKEGVPEEIKSGSQLDNAMMVHLADRVITL